jgi:hypothetical protein
MAEYVVKGWSTDGKSLYEETVEAADWLAAVNQAKTQWDAEGYELRRVAVKLPEEA